MRVIICIDGGGCKGPAAAEALYSIERRINRPLHEVVDLFVGSSVGSILGSIYANGSLAGEQITTLFIEALPRVFKKRFRLPNTPKYSRKPVRDAFRVAIGDPLMRDSKAMFLSSAVNCVDSRTHFFKSWEDKDGALPLIDVVERSFAAPLFFGGIVDQNTSSLWIDGGSGSDNCPVEHALIEAIRQGWFAAGEQVHILSIGCGWSCDDMSWEKAQSAGNLREVLYFADPADGGLARKQATREKVELMQMLTNDLPNFTFQRVDFPLTKAQDAMDRVDLIPLYRMHGIRMGKEIDITPFLL